MGSTTFESLPSEVQRSVYDLLDVPLVCRAYVAFFPRASASPAAASLSTRSVTVKLDTYDTSLDSITFDLLAKLPPVQVKVEATIGMWLHNVHYLNQLKLELLDVAITGEYSSFHGNAGALIHPIRRLKLEFVTVDVSLLPTSLHLLTMENCRVSRLDALMRLSKLQQLVITGNTSNVNGLYNFSPDSETNIMLPASIEEVTLPKHWMVNTDGLHNLKLANVDYSAELPWEQMEKVGSGAIPDENYLPQLTLMTVTKRGFHNSFRGIECPQLESVEIALLARLHPAHTNVSVLFTDAQMAKLTQLDARAYDVVSLDPFKLLRVLKATLKEPITQNLPVPPTLEELHVVTSFPVEGIPPQVKVFYVRMIRRGLSVTVASPNVGDMLVYFAGDVSLSCPQLRLLELGECTGKVTRDTPNLNKVCVYKLSGDEFSTCSTLSAYKLIDGTLRDGIALDQHMLMFTLREVETPSVSVDADHVEIHSSYIRDKLSVRAASMVLGSLPHRPVFDVSCGSLMTSCIDPALIRGVQDLICYPDHFLRDVCRSDAFEGCYQLKCLTIRGFKTSWCQAKPLVIPASVTSLIIIGCHVDEMWIKFEDPSRLEHLEITYPPELGGGWNPPLITMKTLGLQKLPPSFLCPLFEVSSFMS